MLNTLIARGRAAARLAALLLVAAGNAAAAGLAGTDFVLTDDTGKTLRLDSFVGRPVVISMEYSRCRFVCTSTFSRLKEVQAYADANNLPLDIVVVSLDPANDTPAEWREYRKMRGLSGPRWHLLTPKTHDLPRIAQLLGVRYWYVGEHLMHDFKLTRLNTRGDAVAEMVTYDAEVARFMR